MQPRAYLLAALAASVLLAAVAQPASAQAPDVPYGYGRRPYDEGYRGPPPPPPPRGYYEERRYAPRPPGRRGGVFCAREGGFCHFEGPAIVRYGAGGRFTTRRAFNGIPCTNDAFGDPARGLDKACYID